MENNNQTKAGESYSLKDYVILNGGSSHFTVRSNEQVDETTGVCHTYFVVRFDLPGQTTKLADGREVPATLDFAFGRNTAKLHKLTPDASTDGMVKDFIKQNIKELKARLATNKQGQLCKMATIFMPAAEGEAW
jgi:hypothetical protein